MRGSGSTGRSRGPSDHDFPIYRAAETATDRVIHLVGVAGAVLSAAWLTIEVGPTADFKTMATLLVYGVALIATLATSAAYNLSRPSRVKEKLRRADHAMIYVMIAGSYTPFALNGLPTSEGEVLCAAVWLLAAIGIGAKLVFPRRFERLLLLLYLGMGWSVLCMINSFIALLPRNVLLLLLFGGVAYTSGAVFYCLKRVPFHNAVWHAMVLVGAGLHLAAVSSLFARPK